MASGHAGAHRVHACRHQPGRADASLEYDIEPTATLLRFMNQGDDPAAVVASRGDQMNAFRQPSPARRSRLARCIELPDLSKDQLMAMAALIVRRQQYELDDEAREALDTYLARRVIRRA